MIPALTDDVEGFNTSVKGVTEDDGETEKELELEVEPDDVSELLQPHENTSTDEELLLTWAKKVVSWAGLYFWWRYYEDCWEDTKGLWIWHKFSW